MYLNSSSSELHTGSNDQLSGIQCKNLCKNTIRYIVRTCKNQDIPSNSKDQAQEGSQRDNQGVLSTAPIYQNVNISFWIQRLLNIAPDEVQNQAPSQESTSPQ